jgi:hypothetical protein
MKLLILTLIINKRLKIKLNGSYILQRNTPIFYDTDIHIVLYDIIDNGITLLLNLIVLNKPYTIMIIIDYNEEDPYLFNLNFSKDNNPNNYISIDNAKNYNRVNHNNIDNLNIMDIAIILKFLKYINVDKLDKTMRRGEIGKLRQKKVNKFKELFSYVKRRSYFRNRIVNTYKNLLNKEDKEKLEELFPEFR